MPATLPFVHSLAHIDVCVAAIRSARTPVYDVVSGVDVRTLTPTTLGRMLTEANLASMLHQMREQVEPSDYLSYAESLETYAWTAPTGRQQDPARAIATDITALRGLYEQVAVPGLAGVRIAGILAAAICDLTGQLTELLANPEAAALPESGPRRSLPPGL